MKDMQYKVLTSIIELSKEMRPFPVGVEIADDVRRRHRPTGLLRRLWWRLSYRPGVYAALADLQAQGYIAAQWVLYSHSRKDRHFVATAKGRAALHNEVNI